MPKPVRISESRYRVQFVVPIPMWERVERLSGRLGPLPLDIAVIALGVGLQSLEFGLRASEEGMTTDQLHALEGQAMREMLPQVEAAKNRARKAG